MSTTGADPAKAIVADEAHVKMLAYASKYPASNLTGVLVGTSSNTITDMIPLTHTYTTAMTIQIALSELSKAGLKPVGVFWASESANLSAISAGAASLLTTIAADLSNGALLLRLRTASLEAFASVSKTQPLFDALYVSASTSEDALNEHLRQRDLAMIAPSENARTRAISLLKKDLENNLFDLDNYLDGSVSAEEWIKASRFWSSEGVRGKGNSGASRKDE